MREEDDIGAGVMVGAGGGARLSLERDTRGPAAWGGRRRTLPAMQVGERRWRG